MRKIEVYLADISLIGQTGKALIATSRLFEDLFWNCDIHKLFLGSYNLMIVYKGPVSAGRGLKILAFGSGKIIFIGIK